jgi:hypothetical protein
VPSTLSRAVRIVGVASRIVPARLRADWRQEWEGELSAATDQSRLVRHALGSFVDAFWIRQREVADLDVIDDLRHGSRQLRQHAGFAITAVGILAVSMAASVTAFSVVSQILLRPLPYPEPERIVTVWERQMSSPVRNDPAPGNFLDWRARAQSFSRLAAAEPYSYDYTGGDRPEVLKALNVTEGFFDVFGVAPLAGRFFRPDEHKNGNHRVAVLTAKFWRTQLRADPNIIGKAIPIDEQPYVVVGVAPDDFQPHLLDSGANDRALWAPKVIEEYEPRIRVSGYWAVVGRLKEGVSIDRAQAEMDTLSSVIETENPRTNKGVRAAVITLRDHLVGGLWASCWSRRSCWRPWRRSRPWCSPRRPCAACRPGGHRRCCGSTRSTSTAPPCCLRRSWPPWSQSQRAWCRPSGCQRRGCRCRASAP